MSTYDLGDVATLGVAVTDSAGAAADATAVAATITLPDLAPPPPPPSPTPAPAPTASAAPHPGRAAPHRWLATGVNASAHRHVHGARHHPPPAVVSPHRREGASTSPPPPPMKVATVPRRHHRRREQYTGRVFGRRTITETLSGRVPTFAPRPTARSCPSHPSSNPASPSPPTTTRCRRLPAVSFARTSGTQLRNWTVGTNNITVVYVAGTPPSHPPMLPGVGDARPSVVDAARHHPRHGGGDEWNPPHRSPSAPSPRTVGPQRDGSTAVSGSRWAAVVDAVVTSSTRNCRRPCSTVSRSHRTTSPTPSSSGTSPVKTTAPPG